MLCDLLVDLCVEFGIGVDELVVYCWVVLCCGGCMLLEVENWYVFVCFIVVMNYMLEIIDVLFGKVV